MSGPCQPWSCPPITLLCCCPPLKGITVYMNESQITPEGNIVSNPCYDLDKKESYYSYKFFTDCAQDTNKITSFVIPICQTITDNIITVEEFLCGCTTFQEVSFTLTKKDSEFGDAPTGYQFLKVETDERYDQGAAVTYRVTIKGDYPDAAQPITVKAGNDILAFQCDPEKCFVVPRCPEAGKLLLVKGCQETIEHNNVTLGYSILVENVGETKLTAVNFKDIITYDASNIVLGEITVEPSTLKIDTSFSGEIVISGNLGKFEAMEKVEIFYTVKIASIINPGNYLINNTSTATAQGTEATDNCRLNIEAVQMEPDKCCIIDGNKCTFQITFTNVGSSPETNIGFIDQMMIPQNVTVQFQSFDGCLAQYADGTSVPLNTNITNKIIKITNPSLTIPKNASIRKLIKFTIISTSAFMEEAVIGNTLQDVIFLNEGKQVLLDISPLPVAANVKVVGNIQCTKPCPTA